MQECQKKVAVFCKKYKLNCPVEYRLLDILSELGEVAKECLTASRYGKKKFTSIPDWEMELGDLLFSVLCVANSTNVDLRKALTKVLKKYEKRMRSKVSIASS